MSKTSSEHKRQNTDNRIKADLQEILQYCEMSGHRPAQGSRLGIVLSKTQILFYMRKTKKVSTPKEIIALYKKIMVFPTEKTQKRKDLLFKQASLKASRKNTFELKYKKIQKLTSLDLKILKLVCGKEKFYRFVNTDIDVIATKAFLEFFEKLFNETCGKREIIMIELLTGSRKGASHWIDVERCSDKERLLIAKYKKGEPLTTKEVAQLFLLNYGTVRKIVKCAMDRLHEPKKKFVRLLNIYLSGNTNALMAELPSKKADMYKYQKSMNLQDVPSGVLNSVGKKLMAFFGKEKN